MTGLVMVTKGGGCAGGGDGGGGNAKPTRGTRTIEEEQNQLSLVAFLLAALRKSMVSCRVERGEDVISAVQNMEIGWPTNVRHITHVTFDRFNGFLGLPVEFEVEIPCRVPSASASVFGVSADSMQCSFDLKGNSVPTILLLMQERLYSQGGLKAEGIFRINPENSQEEHPGSENFLRECWMDFPLKKFFNATQKRKSVELVKQLKPTEAALLNWAVDLMADVVEEEESNKMNARNIAMVFAPNMTQMSDPLTALMHAVQVMNLLKTLIMKTLREREENASGGYSPVSSHSSDRQSEEDYDSQQEMDTSCELRGPTSDYDDHAHYTHSSDDGDEGEGESLSEIEECFLRKLDENQNVTNSFTEQPVGDIQGEHASSRRWSGLNLESGISFTDSKKENSSCCTSDTEDSGASLIAVERKTLTESSSQGHEKADNMEMVDKPMDSILPQPSCV
ncbi:Rho GTPase-activating protein [Melia azedarach]|uniref:Rho GTPase-activating protein n=1 Tax=Melia azedarach TaxID=155640 RepID=A0ACC1YVS4_MELAZ|nr:Rho GTPase-activating protein [Melia azedarach]